MVTLIQGGAWHYGIGDVFFFCCTLNITLIVSLLIFKKWCLRAMSQMLGRCGNKAFCLFMHEIWCTYVINSVNITVWQSALVFVLYFPRNSNNDNFHGSVWSRVLNSCQSDQTCRKVTISWLDWPQKYTLAPAEEPTEALMRNWFQRPGIHEHIFTWWWTVSTQNVVQSYLALSLWDVLHFSMPNG